MLPILHEPMDQNIIKSHIRSPINQFPHSIEYKQSIIQAPNSTVSIDGKSIDGFDPWAAKDAIRARTWLRRHTFKEHRAEGIKAISNSKCPNHPLIDVMVMAIRVNGGSPLEDMEVKVGELRVVMELVLEKMEQNLWGYRRF